MSKRNIFVGLNPAQAAEMAVRSQQSLVSGQDLPRGLGKEFIDAADNSIDRRMAVGMGIIATSRIEVRGLANAVMGGYDHVPAAHNELCRYVVGVLRSTPELRDKTKLNLQAEITGGAEAIK